jgi:hypothetical protein
MAIAADPRPIWPRRCPYSPANLQRAPDVRRERFDSGANPPQIRLRPLVVEPADAGSAAAMERRRSPTISEQPGSGRSASELAKLGVRGCVRWALCFDFSARIGGAAGLAMVSRHL